MIVAAYIDLRFHTDVRFTILSGVPVLVVVAGLSSYSIAEMPQRFKPVGKLSSSIGEPQSAVANGFRSLHWYRLVSVTGVIHNAKAGEDLYVLLRLQARRRYSYSGIRTDFSGTLFRKLAFFRAPVKLVQSFYRNTDWFLSWFAAGEASCPKSACSS